MRADEHCVRLADAIRQKPRGISLVIRVFRYLRRQFETQLLTRPGSAFIPAAILALVFASAERTFTGMRNFTGNENTINAIAVSILITFGVQMLLLVLAWRIGDAYATSGYRSFVNTAQLEQKPLRRRLSHLATRNFFVQNFLLILSFFICAAICVFFSFDAFYQVINKTTQRQIVAKNEALAVIQAIDTNLTKALKNEQDGTAAKLVSGPFWEQYKTRIGEVVSVATDPSIAESQKTRDDKRKAEENDRDKSLQLKLNEATSARDRLAASTAQLERDLAKATAQQTQLEDDQQKLAAEIAEKNQKTDETRTLLNREERIGNGQRTPGRGPVWRDYNRTLGVLQQELVLLQPRKTSLDQQVSTAKDSLSNLETGLQKAKLDLANAVSAVTALQKERSSQGSRGTDSADTTTADKAKNLNSFLITFQGTPTSAGWKTLTTDCAEVLNLLRASSDSRASASTLDCSPPSATLALADALSELETRRSTFKEKCSANSGDVTFEQRIRRGEQCLQVAQLQNEEVAALRRRLDRVSEEQDESAHTFTRTLFAFGRGDNLAYLSLLIALGLDGLILLCGLWGARARVSHLTRRDDETASEIDDHARMAMMVEVRPEALRPAGGWADPADVYKARVFLRHLEPYAGQSEFTGTVSTANMNEIEREVMKYILALGPYAQQAGSPSRAGLWLISNRLIRYLTRIVASHDSLRHLYDSPEASTAAYEPVQTAPRAQPGFSPTSHWANAAAATNRSARYRPSTEEDYVTAGYGAHVDSPGPVANENSAEVSERQQDDREMNRSA
jgi:hypothetical protein